MAILTPSPSIWRRPLATVLGPPRWGTVAASGRAISLHGRPVVVRGTGIYREEKGGDGQPQSGSALKLKTSGTREEGASIDSLSSSFSGRGRQPTRREEDIDWARPLSSGIHPICRRVSQTRDARPRNCLSGIVSLGFLGGRRHASAAFPLFLAAISTSRLCSGA